MELKDIDFAAIKDAENPPKRCVSNLRNRMKRLKDRPNKINRQ